MFNPENKFSQFRIYGEFRRDMGEFFSKRFKLPIYIVMKESGVLHENIISKINYFMKSYDLLLKNPEKRKHRAIKIPINKGSIRFKADNDCGHSFTGDDSKYDIWIDGIGYFIFSEKINLDTYRTTSIHIEYTDELYVLHTFEDISIKRPKSDHVILSDDEEFDRYYRNKHDDQYDDCPENHMYDSYDKDMGLVFDDDEEEVFV
jgi:hypothetical protein